MESNNNLEVLSKQGSGVSFEKRKKELVKNFNRGKWSVPDWKNFDIKDIAEIYVWSNRKIILKNVKETATWEKFIEINWRKYYEFDWKWTPKNSFYLNRWGALFLGDKIGWLSIWDWVSFRCLHENIDSFLFEQRGTRYSWGAMHLQQLYKSEVFPSGGAVTTINRKWRSVKITKNLIEKYLDWSVCETSKRVIEDAIKSDPEFLAYVESFNK